MTRTASRLAPTCPVCEKCFMEYACRVRDIEIYGCKDCGATLIVPAKT